MKVSVQHHDPRKQHLVDPWLSGSPKQAGMYVVAKRDISAPEYRNSIYIFYTVFLLTESNSRRQKFDRNANL